MKVLICTSGPACVEPFSVWLDLFRWIAAAVVVVSHAGGILLIALSDLPSVDRTAAQFLYSFVAGFAHYAVMVFFVMSGYLVGGSFLRAARNRSFTYHEYLLKRFVRLYIVLIPTFLLTFVLGMAAVHFLDVSDLTLYDKFVKSSDGVTAFCNTGFMQNIMCFRYGGNDSLWSLSHEALYYIAFPLVSMPLVSKGSTMQFGLGLLAIALLVLLSVMQFSNVNIVAYFTIWCLGAMLSILKITDVSVEYYYALVLFCIVVIIFRLIFPFVESRKALLFICDLLVALTFCACLLFMRSSSTLLAPPFAGIHIGMSQFSYSLYCLHFPVLMFYAALMETYFGMGYDMVPRSWINWLIVLGGIAVSFVSSFAFYLVTEKHTEQLRTAVTSLLDFGKRSARGKA